VRTVFTGELAQRYLDAVAARIAHLPEAERVELLDDLEQHLRELAAEPAPLLSERLGDPGAYAEEFVASLGIVPPTPGGRARISARALRAWVEALRAHPRTAAALATARELQPAWWAARGYLAVAAVAALDGDRTPLVLPDVGGDAVGLLVAVAAAWASVRLGRRAAAAADAAGAGGVRLLERAASVAGVLAVIVVVAQLREGPGVRYVDNFSPPAYAEPYLGEGVVSGADGAPLVNLFVYDQEGNLLDRVLIYDQDGRPVRTLRSNHDPRTGDELDVEVPADANGAPVLHAYPRTVRRTTWDGSGGRQQVDLPPAVVVPRLEGTTSATVRDEPGGPVGPESPMTTMAPSAPTTAPVPTTAAVGPEEVPTTTEATTLPSPPATGG